MIYVKAIGEGQRWLVMQMHYFNPKLVQDVYDSSGIRLYITKELRPIDGGLMQFNSAIIEGMLKVYDISISHKYHMHH